MNCKIKLAAMLSLTILAAAALTAAALPAPASAADNVACSCENTKNGVFVSDSFSSCYDCRKACAKIIADKISCINNATKASPDCLCYCTKSKAMIETTLEQRANKSCSEYCSTYTYNYAGSVPTKDCQASLFPDQSTKTKVTAPDSGKPVALKLQIPIGDSSLKEGGKYDFSQKVIDITAENTTRPIAEYFRWIYKYLVGIVGILATVMLMYGGIRWLISAGDAGGVTEARNIIMSSLIGLIMTVSAYLILAMVNTSLVNFQLTKIDTIKMTGCCVGEDMCRLHDEGTCPAGKKFLANGSCFNGVCSTKDPANDLPKSPTSGCCLLSQFDEGSGSKYAPWRCYPTETKPQCDSLGTSEWSPEFVEGPASCQIHISSPDYFSCTTR